MSRMPNPALAIPGLADQLQTAAQTAHAAAAAAGVPVATINLIELRASQINGCATCLDMHDRTARKAGETSERLATLAAWRETPYFDEAERAALALTEAGTRLGGGGQPVPEAVYEQMAKHYSEKGTAALIAVIAMINAWNRMNIISGQVTGPWVEQWVA